MFLQGTLPFWPSLIAVPGRCPSFVKKVEFELPMYYRVFSWFFVTCLVILFLHSLPGYSQVEKADEKFPNGQPKYNGKYIKCTTQDEQWPHVTNYEKRKFGEWIYYYPSGTVSRIRNYTRKVRKCNERILKEGEWKYYNEAGVLFRAEKYSNDTLVYAETNIYEHHVLIARIITTDGSKDTVHYVTKTPSGNLIPNPSFDQFFHKPVPVINDGQNQVEQLIPYWFSPDKATPDYYNRYRGLAGVPHHFESEPEATDANGYMGLMLFRGDKRKVGGSLLAGKENRPENFIDYKEAIQSKLIKKLVKGKVYCFKGRIALSRNAGYCIDAFEVLFSEGPVQFTFQNPSVDPRLTFSGIQFESSRWMPICRSFIALGDEGYITLGRFSNLESVSVRPHTPKQYSNLEINRSAYLLLDDLQLFEVDSSTACGCVAKKDEPSANNVFRKFEFDEITEGNKYILEGIRFDFDKASIRNSSLPELERVVGYMERYPAVRIMISGHTDNVGTEDYNKDLSVRRAQQVKQWLISRGIDEKRISYEGLGSSFPLLDNSSEGNRIINRRIEFEVLK